MPGRFYAEMMTGLERLVLTEIMVHFGNMMKIQKTESQIMVFSQTS